MTFVLLVQGVTGSLASADLAIVTTSLLLLFLISYIFGRREKDTQDFFLGGRSVPASVACLSFVATEISALTIVGLPANGYSENWAFMQFFIGSALARLFVAFLFIPAFYKFNCTTIYEYLRYRFGPATQYAGSIFFFITRLMASGVRLYAACMGVAIIMDWSLVQTLMLFSFVSVVVITFGGIKAVVWTGAYQAITFFIAGLALVIYLGNQVEGGIAAAWEIAGQARRLECFRFEFNFHEPGTFWAMVANGFFISLAAFGTDQEMVQRLLTVKTRKSSQKTLLATIVSVFPVYAIYLTIGTFLFVFYQQNSEIVPPAEAKKVLSFFVSHSLPVGMKGLVLAAVILASIDSPLSSLSSSFVTDIYRPLIYGHGSDGHYLFVSRTGVVMFGLILAGIALACEPVKNILWFAFQIFSVTGGAALGIFLLGLLTRRTANRGNIIAMIVSSLGMAILLLLSQRESHLPLHDRSYPAWSWLVVIGTVLTFVLAYLLGSPGQPMADETPSTADKA